MGFSLGGPGGVLGGVNTWLKDAGVPTAAADIMDPTGAAAGAIGSYLTPALPGLPAIPQMPGFVPDYMHTPQTKTNFGSFGIPSMQETAAGGTHPAVHTNGVYPTPPPAPPTKTPNPNPPGIGNPGFPGNPPPPPGGPGAPVQPKSVASTPMNATMQAEATQSRVASSMRTQFAQTPNTVLSASGMTVPGNGAVSAPSANQPTAANGPGGGGLVSGNMMTAGGRR